MYIWGAFHDTQVMPELPSHRLRAVDSDRSVQMHRHRAIARRSNARFCDCKIVERLDNLLYVDYGRARKLAQTLAPYGCVWSVLEKLLVHNERTILQDRNTHLFTPVRRGFTDRFYQVRLPTGEGN
jgi:hypothetical protein